MFLDVFRHFTADLHCTKLCQLMDFPRHLFYHPNARPRMWCCCSVVVRVLLRSCQHLIWWDQICFTMGNHDQTGPVYQGEWCVPRCKTRFVLASVRTRFPWTLRKMQAHSPPSGHVHTGAGAGQDFFLGLWHVMAMWLWVNTSSWCAAGANVAGEVQIWRRWPGGPLAFICGSTIYTQHVYIHIYIL